MRLLLFSDEDNCLGRAYCLWLLAHHLGWSCTPVVPRGALWPPLEGTEFSARTISPEQIREDFDVVIVHQPIPETLGAALRLTPRRPIIIDVDEPVWERRYGSTRLGEARIFAGLLRRGRNPLTPHRLRREARHRPMLLSSPGLRPGYTGAVIPHVRVARPVTEIPRGALTLAFVGTPREHKGLTLLRDAAERAGVTLTLTADAPADARPNERWVGATSIEAGARIVEASSCVVVPSLDTPFARGQLPVKLIDGMLAGRAVIASDLPPISWALGDAGILVPPGDLRSLIGALTRLRDDRAEVLRLSAAARARALAKFTPEAVAPCFADAVTSALASTGR
jgi:glycosyltransferase involved in cell wall biosynthesis